MTDTGRLNTTEARDGDTGARGVNMAATDATAHYGDGGPVYPGPVFTQTGYKAGHSMGMSLRDWFAGQANEDDIERHRVGHIADDGAFEYQFSREVGRYRYADAMLAARAAL